MSAAQQEEYLNKLRQQIQAQTIQEIMQKMNEKCFKVCKYFNLFLWQQVVLFECH